MTGVQTCALPISGFIREKVSAYLKALPKSIRKQLMPIADHVTGFLEEADRGASSTSLSAALAHYVKMRSGELAFKGQAYLLHYALPNFFFHVTTAYAILRHNGVEVGKSDFLGPQPAA